MSLTGKSVTWPKQPVKEPLIVRLQKRDYLVLSYIGENRAAPADVLCDLFWKGRKDNSHYKRLRKLLRAGLIQSVHENLQQPLWYCLTAMGGDILKAKGLAAIPGQVKRPRYGSSLEHDRNLHLIRQVYESLSTTRDYLTQFQVEKILGERHGYQKEREEKYKVPDAIFTLKLPGKTVRVAVEHEKEPKNYERTKRMFELLVASPDYETIFFVVSSPKLMARLMRILAELRKTSSRIKADGKRHAFYFVLLDELLQKKTKAVMEGEGAKIVLETLGEPSPVDPNVAPNVGPRGAN